MTADERYDLICLKIERAKEHILNLYTEMRAFLDAKPYVIGTKSNPETRQLIYYLTSVRDAPIRLSVLTGDVLQNLRTALDHLAYNLVAVNGFVDVASGTPLTPHDLRQINFPIINVTDPQKYESGRAGKVKGMRPDAIKAIDLLKPYKCGNELLWRLSELNNRDKHRLLVMVGSEYRSVNITPHAIRLMNATNPFPDLALQNDSFPPIFLRPADRLFPLKAGDELFVDVPDAEVDKNVQFTFDVAISEPQIIQGEPLIPTLNNFTNIVENIVLDFKPLLI